MWVRGGRVYLTNLTHIIDVKLVADLRDAAKGVINDRGKTVGAIVEERLRFN